MPASGTSTRLTIEVVLMVLMVVAAVNFARHFVALRKGDPGAYRRDPEARCSSRRAASRSAGVSTPSGTLSTIAASIRMPVSSARSWA